MKCYIEQNIIFMFSLWLKGLCAELVTRRMGVWCWLWGPNFMSPPSPLSHDPPGNCPAEWRSMPRNPASGASWMTMAVLSPWALQWQHPPGCQGLQQCPCGHLSLALEKHRCHVGPSPPDWKWFHGVGQPLYHWLGTSADAGQGGSFELYHQWSPHRYSPHFLQQPLGHGGLIHDRGHPSGPDWGPQDPAHTLHDPAVTEPQSLHEGPHPAALQGQPHSHQLLRLLTVPVNPHPQKGRGRASSLKIFILSPFTQTINLSLRRIWCEK